MAREKEQAGEFWHKVHYKHYKTRTLCNRSVKMSIKSTQDKKKVTCKTCKALLRYMR